MHDRLEIVWSDEGKVEPLPGTAESGITEQTRIYRKIGIAVRALMFVEKANYMAELVMDGKPSRTGMGQTQAIQLAKATRLPKTAGTRRGGVVQKHDR